MTACNIDQDLLINFIDIEEEMGPLPKAMQGFGKYFQKITSVDMLNDIHDIDYLCGARFRGQLQGKYRHGIGSIQYSENEPAIIGYWKDDICIHEGVKHPIKELQAIAVA